MPERGRPTPAPTSPGDGLNDGPTLAAADVSVAIGTAVPLTQAQSDLVLPGAQLSMLPVMLGQSRRTLRIIRQNLAWAAIYNATCVPLALSGLLPAWLACKVAPAIQLKSQ